MNTNLKHFEMRVPLTLVITTITNFRDVDLLSEVIYDAYCE